MDASARVWHGALVEMSKSAGSPPRSAAYVVSARRWRPQTFEDLVGQEHVSRTLANAIRAGDRELADRLLVAHMDDAVARLTTGPLVDGAEPAST